MTENAFKQLVGRFRNTLIKMGLGRPDGESSSGPPIRPGVPQKLNAALARQLKERRARLGDCARGVESEFLEISTNLEALATRGDELLKGSERLIELSLGKIEGLHLLQEVPAMVNKPIDFIARFNEEVVRLIERLTHMDETTSLLMRMQTQLTDAFAPLRIIQVLYRIESERLAENDRKVFRALTGEMSRIEERMLCSFEKQFAQLSATRDQLRNTIAQLRVGVQKRGAQFQSKRQAIDEMIKRVNHEVKLNEQHESRLSQTSRSLMVEINRVVMAIQHQDIVEQRLKHVDKAVEKLETLLTEFPSLDRKERRAKLAVIHALSRLEREQLREVDGQLNSALAEIDGGIKTVTNTIKTVDAQCMNLNDFGHVTAAVDGMVQVLLDTLADVSQLLQDTLTEADQTYDTIKPLGGQAADLTDTVTNLSFAIKLIALNAQVHAGKIEDAQSLEVLSARTSEIANEANNISIEVAGKLEGFSREMDRFVAGFEDIRGAGKDEVGHLNEQSVSARERLHTYRDTTLQSLNEVGGMVQHLNELSGSREHSFKSRTRLHEEIAALGTIVENVDQGVARLCDPAELDRESGAELDELLKSYTMVSERSVHDRVLNRSRTSAGPAPEPAVAAAPAAITTASESADGLGDNIELF